ncbi:hypothetical protein HOE37_01805 [Candidatus Woesearchaeota archaeon]|jgi:hypothetical protein|nr:hypothetical protein [Candidatus Woesearchaeota archaeon]MBT4110568.1 hypothetical protein [Candidatus Woesearchaeota archaeon]MBT4335908.1 hypothetical protein [Candidatus Woesearchaeota archaeon]MBT4469113.1 hypothetical protein [Candidatus Woesearchaeota archaeon]MBT6744568.1 hypothetical protein [Candidatus Woesearchaeota archaeon]
MDILTIILFFVYLLGFGYTMTSLLKLKIVDKWESFFMILGIGLGVILIVSVFFNFVRIPLDWRIFLSIGLIYPLIKFIVSIKNKPIHLDQFKFKFKPNLKIKKSHLIMFTLLIIFGATFFMYYTGATAYPYLENADPWSHANGAQYISLEKTAYDPPREILDRHNDQLTYLDPYPPAYDILMALLYQTNDSINWTLKFFNALIISLSIIFFFFFARNFIGSSNKALFATFILAAIPCYLSHFIWAHSLIPALFFVSMYCLEKIDENKKWMCPAALTIASIAVSQPTQPIKIGFLLLIYFVIKSILAKKFLRWSFISIVAGYVISFIWWGNMLTKYKGASGIAQALGLGGFKIAETSGSSSLFSRILSMFPPDVGSATRAYTFGDFFFAQHNNMINNPIGVGIFISILLVIGVLSSLIFYKKTFRNKNYWLPVTIGWFIFTFLGVNSMTFNLPVGLIAFRFWMLLAIPISLLAAEGYWLIKNSLKKVGIPIIIVLLVVVSGVVLTSAHQKYSANTAIWPTYGYFGGGNPQVAFEYAEWFATLPKGTSVFTYSDRNHLMAGFDAFSCTWCEDIIENTRDQCIMGLNNEELYSFLKRNKYEYLLAGIGDLKYLTPDCGDEEQVNKKFQERINGFVSSPSFQPIYQKENLYVVFKIV